MKKTVIILLILADTCALEFLFSSRDNSADVTLEMNNALNGFP